MSSWLSMPPSLLPHAQCMRAHPKRRCAGRAHAAAGLLPARRRRAARPAAQVKYVKSGAVIIARITMEKPICVEQFDVVPQLGRFTLRDEGRTIAIGKVIKLPKTLKAGD